MKRKNRQYEAPFSIKRMLFKGSILFPISIIIFVTHEYITLTISEIGFYLDYGLLYMFFLASYIIWLCCSPFRKNCCDGTWAEMVFNLLPSIALLMLVFAQWHFWIFISIIVFIVVTEVVFDISLYRDERKSSGTSRWKYQKRINKILFQRFTLLVIGVSCAVPCFVAVFVYGFRSPTYEAKPDAFDILLQEPEPTVEGPDSYEENYRLFLCFRTRQWKKYDIQEKTTLVQELADFEAEILGIPSVHLTVKKLGGFTLGEYSLETNEICVDVEHLGKSPVEEVINTVCHEMHHAYQHYLVDNIDWDSTITETSLFAEVRSWRENENNYRQPYVDGYISYETQPVEAAASKYAEGETSRILSLIGEGEKSNSLESIPASTRD